MSALTKLAVPVAVMASAALLACGSGARRDDGDSKQASAQAPARPAQPVPKLVDLGAGKCIPCKAMAPILEQLRADYVGRLDVQFIDVWQNPEAGDAHHIRMIPTQIFYGANGRELARHEGFMAREEILAQWQALGVSL